MTPTPLFLFGKAWMEEPDRLWSMGSWKVGHDWATNHTCMCQADSFSQKEHETDDARIESLVQEASCFFFCSVALEHTPGAKWLDQLVFSCNKQKIQFEWTSAGKNKKETKRRRDLLPLYLQSPWVEWHQAWLNSKLKPGHQDLPLGYFL